MRYETVRRILNRFRERRSRWFAVMAALCCVLGLILAGSATTNFRDSVRPCVPCHNRGESDQVAEWLASPYSESEGGLGCVECHGRDCFGNGDEGKRVERFSPANLLSIREAIRLGVTATRIDNMVSVEVAVTNVGAGHALPAESGGNTLLLEVTAHHREDSTLLWQAGPRAVLLAPFATEVNRYRFASPKKETFRVTARLVLEPADAPAQELAEAATVCSAIGEES